jgi:hypothetical protein
VSEEIVTRETMSEQEMRRDPGYIEVRSCLAFVWPEQFVARLGMRGLNWLIRRVLDNHYPLDIFPIEQVEVDAFADAEPGVRWVACLRQALKEAEGEV